MELPPDTDTSPVRGVLAGLPEVRDVVIAGRSVSARSEDGAAAVPVVLAALQPAGVSDGPVGGLLDLVVPAAELADVRPTQEASRVPGQRRLAR